MSITIVATVHCDGCSQWEYTADATTGRNNRADRRRRGWTSGWHRPEPDDLGSYRTDWCPSCSAKRAAGTGER